MRNIVYSKKYRKDMKLMIKQGADIDLHDNIVEMLCAGQQFPQKYRDHELRGQWKGFRELHISPDWLLIYGITDEAVMLARTGSHANIYGL